MHGWNTDEEAQILPVAGVYGHLKQTWQAFGVEHQ
jgi:hypothetical protein